MIVRREKKNLQIGETNHRLEKFYQTARKNIQRLVFLQTSQGLFLLIGMEITVLMSSLF